jgi:hypothetical protein
VDETAQRFSDCETKRDGLLNAAVPTMVVPRSRPVTARGDPDETQQDNLALHSHAFRPLAALRAEIATRGARRRPA